MSAAAAMVARLRATRSPAVWWTAVVACRLARRLSPHRSRWSSRLGYALERFDQARQESATRPGWTVRLPRPAGRHLRQARRRERRADWAGAAAAYQAAVARDSSRAVWWFQLGRCRAAAGDRPGAVVALQWACELGAAAHPGWRVQLADLHDGSGDWEQARRVLTENATQHPAHPATHRRLGEVSGKLGAWGGSFGAAAFRPDPAARSATAAGRHALERAAELEPAKTAWREPLAEARLADGDLPGAARLYQAALRDAEESTGLWGLAVKQRWQFRLESIHHALGQPRVTDPLFDCAVEPIGSASGQDPALGVFTARTSFAGLAITGLVADPAAGPVEVRLAGVPLRSVNLGGDSHPRQFALELRRATVARFPRQAELAVRAADGRWLSAPGGAARLRITMPHGDGRLPEILAAGGTLDKKGAISPSAAETRQRQQRYLEIYTQVREFFEQRLGRSLFLMYGTLLGLHRDGDFIPGDDDFDCGYVSDRTDPAAVKDETKQVIVELIRAGFTVSFNRRGRLFRVQLEREATDGFHLDVRPLWFQRGRLWAHNHCSFPSTRADFLPTRQATLRGVPVSVPADPESFLRGHYGPGWKVPDPGFMYYLSEIDPAILENLSRALITVREYRELAARVQREIGAEPPAGRLVSVGSQDLYPLDQFLA